MKKLLALAATVAVAAALSGCGQAAEPEVEVPKYDGMDAAQVVDFLKSEGLPIEDVVVYDEATDPNGSLGRPGEYSSKASFVDGSLKPEWDAAVQYANQYNNGELYETPFDYGGTVEVFDTVEECVARAEYLQTFIDGGGILGKFYMYRYDNVLLRLDYDVIPSDAAKYEAAFMGEAAEE